MTRKNLILPCALLALAGCNGAEGIGGPTDDSGSLRFSHSTIAQLPAATYHAEGEVGLSGTGQFSLGDWAFAQLSASASDPLVVLASQPSVGAEGRHDFTIIDLPRNVQAGATVPLSIDCGMGGSASCAELSVSFRLTPRGDNPDYGCNLTTGQVRVTERTSDRIAGTFSGSGQCFGPAANTEQALQVTAGTFDVPLISFNDLR